MPKIKKTKRFVFKQSEGFVDFREDLMGTLEPFLEARGEEIGVKGNKSVIHRAEKIQELLGKRSQWVMKLTDALGYKPNGRKGWILNREGIPFQLTIKSKGIQIRVANDLMVRDQMFLLDEIIRAIEGT